MKMRRVDSLLPQRTAARFFTSTGSTGALSRRESLSKIFTRGAESVKHQTWCENGHMLPLNLNDLTATHIESLIESEVPESLTLDYKQQLPSKGSDDKKEFLYDVAAMANSAGGDLVYGIAERRTEDDKPTGIPDRLLGTRFVNSQEEDIRLSSYIRDGMAPNLIGVVVRSVPCEGGDALVVRVPASRSKPHMVKMGGTNKFYKRTGTVSHPMDWDEIRRAFSEQGELREALASWRAHRLDLIEQRRGPVLLDGEVAMLFHIIPADAFTPGMFTEAWRLPQDQKKEVFVPYGNYYQRYNADGFLCHSNRAVAGPHQKTDGYWGYTQLLVHATVSVGHRRVRFQPFLSSAD